MNYAFRWYYAITSVAVIFIFAYIELIKPMLASIASLSGTEKSLHEKLDTLRRATEQQIVMAQKKSPDAQRNIMADVYAAIHLSGLQMLSADFAATKKDFLPGSQSVRLVLSGDFYQLNHFFFLLSQRSYPVLIKDYSFHSMPRAGLRFTLDLTVFDAIVTPAVSEHINTSFYSPFCGQRDRIASSDNEMRTFSIKQMRMSGYMQMPGHFHGLIMLPTNTVIEVSKGTVLGSEGAVVTSVEVERIRLEMPDGRLLILPSPLVGEGADVYIAARGINPRLLPKGRTASLPFGNPIPLPSPLVGEGARRADEG